MGAFAPMRPVLLALLLCLLAPAVAGAVPGSAPVPFPAVSGSVVDTLVDGDTAYIAGNFPTVGAPSGPLSFMRADGSVSRSFPDITSLAGSEDADLSVTALAADGAGGFYVGGEFDRVLGVRRVGLVHLLADGSIDPAFRAQAVGSVAALELRGDVLYVGGGFDVIGGVARHALAALDAHTGTVLNWGPKITGTVATSASAATGCSSAGRWARSTARIADRRRRWISRPGTRRPGARTSTVSCSPSARATGGCSSAGASRASTTPRSTARRC